MVRAREEVRWEREGETRFHHQRRLVYSQLLEASWGVEHWRRLMWQAEKDDRDDASSYGYFLDREKSAMDQLTASHFGTELIASDAVRVAGDRLFSAALQATVAFIDQSEDIIEAKNDELLRQLALFTDEVRRELGIP
jgi:hypothetical protein